MLKTKVDENCYAISVLDCPLSQDTSYIGEVLRLPKDGYVEWMFYPDVGCNGLSLDSLGALRIFMHGLNLKLHWENKNEV